MTDYAAVLTAIRPGAEWSLNGDGFDLTWLSEGEPPTQAECDAAWPAVQTERGWKAVRAERDRLLAACDWTQVADAPLTAAEKTAWAEYRQALRDVPQDFDSPDDVIWPEVP
jgi:hypothetical protein